MDAMKKNVVPSRARGKEAEAIGWAQGLASGVISPTDFITAMEIFPKKELHIVVRDDKQLNIGMSVLGAGLFDILAAVPANLLDIVPDDYAHLADIEEFLSAGQSMADDMERPIVIRRKKGADNAIVGTFQPAMATLH